MQKMTARWLAALAAATALSVSAPSAFASQTSEPVEIGSLSGAYLAARVAEVDNDLDGAIAYYKKTLAFDPDNEQLQQSLMLALISQGRFDEALPYAEKLKSVADVERFSRLALAVDGFRKKDYSQIEYWMKLALSSDLDDLISKTLTAWAKAGQKNPTAAIQTLDSVEGPEWYGPFLSYHKALIAEQAGRKEEAEATYKATVDDPNATSTAPETWVRATMAYAGFLARDGKKDAALAVLDKAEAVSPGRPQIMALRADISAGRAVAPMVADPAAGASELLLNLATALNRGGGESFVRLYLQYALALKPDSDVVLIELAAVAEQQQQAEDAIALYRRVPANSILKRAADLQLGLNLADLDRHDEAIKELSALLDAQPEDMRAYLALGGVYASKEDYRNAASVYDRAVARLEADKQADAKPNWNIYYQRGIAYERLKEWPKAEPNFRKALELYPNQPQVMNYLGYSWIDMNMNLDEGMDMIRKAVDLRPSDGYIVDSLGWAHYRLGQYQDAVRELERAVALKPDDPVLNDHLGDAYWRAGRKLEATFQWRHAHDMKPEPDILASVQKKLIEGLPPIEDKAAAEDPGKSDPAPAVQPEPEASGKRSEVAPAQETAAVLPVAYKVQPGQSLWSIALDKLGAGSRYIEILNLNPQLQANPGRLMPGQELALPEQD